jgi:hypothetical protein
MGNLDAISGNPPILLVRKHLSFAPRVAHQRDA